MEISTIKELLMKAMVLEEVHISRNGSHFQIIAVSALFAGMSLIKKQQIIYLPLMEYIADNRIHALSIKAYTPEEWQRDSKK